MGINTTDFDSEFVYERHAARHMLLRRDCADALRPALLESPYGAPLQVEGGRGAVRTFPLDAGASPNSQAVLRYYQRGGAMRFLLRDAYFGINRPLREFRAHYQAERLGIPAPRLLAIRWTLRARVLYQQGALITQRLPDARSLAAVLRDNPAPDAVAANAALAGAAIRRMHDQGLWHADLNVNNLLFSSGQVFLLDFDNARIKTLLTTRARARNMLRLLRSLRKVGAPDTAFAALLQGYGSLQIPAWLYRAYQCKWALLDLC